MLPNAIAVIFAILLTVNSCAQAGEHLSFRKEWKFHKNGTIHYSRAIAAEDNSFLYAVCDDSQVPERIDCTVVIEKPIKQWNEMDSSKKTCKFALTRSQTGKHAYEVSTVVSVDRFANDRAIVVWWERERESQFQVKNIRVSLLRTSNCEATHLTFPIDVERRILLSNVIVYPTTFDILVSNRALCGTPTCRISHDIEGRQLGKPSPFVTNFAAVYAEPVDKNSPDKGIYICGTDSGSWNVRVLHVSKDGVGTKLMTASVNDLQRVPRATSNAHELYGICLMGDKRVHCAQFDTAANVRMNATLKASGHIEWIGVHNLAEGGVLLLTGNCNKQKCRNFKVVKVDAAGKEGDALDVHDLHMKCALASYPMSVDVLETQDDFCFYFACGHRQKELDNGWKSSVKFGSKCVPKTEI